MSDPEDNNRTAARKPHRDELHHPHQPIGWDDRGIIRFKENAIVSALLEVASQHGLDLNQIAIGVARGRFRVEDQIQLAELIGYSVSGWGDLSYVPRDMVRRADAKAERIANVG